MESREPPPGPPPGDFDASEESDGTSETDSTSSTSSNSSTDATDELIQALPAAIDKYSSSAALSTEQSGSSSGRDGQSLCDLFGKIDSDGDGSVSKEEFVSNRPEEVSEEQAEEM